MNTFITLLLVWEVIGFIFAWGWMIVGMRNDSKTENKSFVVLVKELDPAKTTIFVFVTALCWPVAAWMTFNSWRLRQRKAL